MPRFKKPLRPNMNSQSVMKNIEGANRKAMFILVTQAKSAATRNMMEITKTKVMFLSTSLQEVVAMSISGKI